MKVVPSSSSTLRVRYAETDKMGVVYYANYFVWFEVARADLLRSLGWSYRDMEQDGIILPVIEAHCEYARPARYDDELEIRTEGRMLSPIRMEFRYQVRLVPDGAAPGQDREAAGAAAALAASGRTVHAALDQTGRPCRLPRRIREVFA